MSELEGRRILLADADDASRGEIAAMVSDFGAKCVSVSTGDGLLEALEKNFGEDVDLVIADVDLPDMSGIDACEAVRASEIPSAKTLPFLALASTADEAVFDRAILAGMFGIVQRPVSREILRAQLTLALCGDTAHVMFGERVRAAMSAVKAKSFFFSTVSHDIRTPLNAIIGFSQLLKLGFDSEEEMQKAVDSIMVSGKTLLQLINDVLDLSKIESGRMTIEPEPTDCRRLVDEIVESFRVANQKPSLEIRAVTSQMPVLMVDPQRIRQIVFNLVGNAVKFTEEGHVEVRASFDRNPNSDDGTLSLEVDDTGCGISEEDQRRIASPYVQVGSKHARNGGTGLGLAICKQLVVAMHGNLEMQSALGCGTTFFVTIPGVRLGGGASHAKLTATQKISVNVASETDLSGTKALVVDDSRVNQVVLTKMLNRLGLKDMTVADNGVAALDVLRKNKGRPFDLVLTDMWMPELDGEGLVREIRSDPALKGLRVYAVTADVERQKDYSEMGFTGILMKPVTFETLKSALA